MNLPKILFYLSTAGLIFAFGLAVGAYQIFPYQQIKFVLNSVEAVLADRERLLSSDPVAFLSPSRYEGEGVTRYAPERAAPGLTLLSGFFDGMPGLRLIRPDGSVVKSWPAEYLTRFADSAHIRPPEDAPASNWNAAVHGMALNRDGSVIFNFDGKGTIKLDACGRTLWTLPRMTHHSIDRAAEGGYWIPSRHWIDEAPTYPLFARPHMDDTILRVSEDGQVMSEISLNRILLDNGLYALLTANGKFRSDVQEKDVLHINDIEELRAEHADAFALFEAGDLLLSLRHLNALMVVEPGAWRVKWYRVGPWMRQHDGDFQADGQITVYNNNSDDTRAGDVLGGSNLMAFDPADPAQTVSVFYGAEEGQAFFTNTQGKHQRLTNGNVLIAEYYGGRAFEITPDGEIVWEYVNRYDDERVARISGAMRYPPGYVDDAAWACPDGR